MSERPQPTMAQWLKAWCASDFPYVCQGEKTVREDGSVECECGNDTVTPEQWAEIQGAKK